MFISRTRLNNLLEGCRDGLLRKEDIASCACGCEALGIKERMIKKIRESTYLNWGYLSNTHHHTKTIDIYFLPPHAPKWDIEKVDTTGKRLVKKYYKSEPPREIEINI